MNNICKLSEWELKAIIRGLSGEPVAINAAEQEAVRQLMERLTTAPEQADLKTLRAIINGKISKRKITPEQQEAMQKARKRKVT